jgi:4'-phosphopantetheinyl transferase
MNTPVFPLTVPPLADDDLHLWAVRLERPYPTPQTLLPLLSADEQTRAARFHFDRDRRHFIVTRGLLRLLLGDYLGRAAVDIQFVYGAQGKPALVGDAPLRFNVAHSHGVAVLGFVRGREIGVDVEQLRPSVDRDMVARRFFSAQEYAVYMQLALQQRERAFFSCWTRKEAFIKAIGEGLSCPLSSFDVTLHPDEPARLTAVRSPNTRADQWQLVSLEPFPGFVAAVMAEMPVWSLRPFTLD